MKSFTDLLPLHNCFQLYIPTGFCHTEFISLNNYQWHTHSYISMFTDFKHYPVCTLSGSNNCFNLRWNDMAILNQNKHCPSLFVLWYWALSTHRTSLALSKCSTTERSLPYFSFFFFLFLSLNLKNLKFYPWIRHLHNLHFVLSSLKFLLCLPNFLSSSWMSSSLLLLCYEYINTMYWVLLVFIYKIYVYMYVHTHIYT